MLMRVPMLPLPPGDRWVNVREVAELFGVDTESVHRWRRAETLKGYKVNRLYWFRKSEVNQFLVSKGLPTF